MIIWLLYYELATKEGIKRNTMNRDEIIKRLNVIFADIFDDEDIVLEETMTSKDIDGWDSLTHISIIASIEEEFKMKFSMDELKNMKSISCIIDIVKEKQVF